MTKFFGLHYTCVFGIIFTLSTYLHTAQTKAATPDASKGQYILTAAGCIGCHTTKGNLKKGVLMSGGRALKTPFGIYYSPNITPDPKQGIGEWTEANFIESLRHGKNPKGEHYLPVFPYTSFTQMTDDDMRDLWAYMKTVPAIADPNIPHTAPAIFQMRFTVGPWKMINFKSGAYTPRKDKSAEWNRGAYLVNALGHCGECHTPRNLMGGLKNDMYMAGDKNGPDGEIMPNITSHKKTGIGNWSIDDLESLFTLGMLPDGDFVGGGMAEVVENLGNLTSEDQKAIISYLISVKAIENKIN